MLLVVRTLKILMAIVDNTINITRTTYKIPLKHDIIKKRHKVKNTKYRYFFNLPSFSSCDSAISNHNQNQQVGMPIRGKGIVGLRFWVPQWFCSTRGSNQRLLCYWLATPTVVKFTNFNIWTLLTLNTLLGHLPVIV